LAELLLSNLSHSYPGAPAATLRGLNLQVASGEAHALLGSSGAGKSTLLNLLSGLLPSSPGQLLLAGRDMAEQPPASRGVAQVFQFPVLYEAMTVLGNLAFPLQVMGLSRRDCRARAMLIAEQLEIDHLLDRRPTRLGLFEKQLVAIGKALVRPDLSLVLLDEPLTAAEPGRKWRLRQTLKSLQRESGATMIYVTHDQTEALTFADRISVMHDGGILQTGSPEQLLNAPGHEHVGYFVGTPGMNFLDARIDNNTCLIESQSLGQLAATSGACRIGFRPEWAELVSTTAQSESDKTSAPYPVLSAEIVGQRVLGTHRGEPFGLVDAMVASIRIVTRQRLRDVSMGPGQLQLAEFRAFREGWALNA
jgi:glycerol transport system ATP-binding protein